MLCRAFAVGCQLGSSGRQVAGSWPGANRRSFSAGLCACCASMTSNEVESTVSQIQDAIGPLSFRSMVRNPGAWLLHIAHSHTKCLQATAF